MDVFAKGGFFLPLSTFDRQVKAINKERKVVVRSVFLLPRM
jgi:hypothetical protein